MNCPHCKTPIDEHKANPCLDAWVAIAVFGKTLEWKEGGEPIAWDGESGEPVLFSKGYWFDASDETVFLHVTDGFTGMVPMYSEYIAYAWFVVEILRLTVFPNRLSPLNPEGGWGASQPLAAIALGDNPTLSLADTAPLAICRAALKAKTK